jgi:hypothetical protein
MRQPTRVLPAPVGSSIATSRSLRCRPWYARRTSAWRTYSSRGAAGPCGSAGYSASGVGGTGAVTLRLVNATPQKTTTRSESVSPNRECRRCASPKPSTTCSTASTGGSCGRCRPVLGCRCDGAGWKVAKPPALHRSLCGVIHPSDQEIPTLPSERHLVQRPRSPRSARRIRPAAPICRTHHRHVIRCT